MRQCRVVQVVQRLLFAFVEGQITSSLLNHRSMLSAQLHLLVPGEFKFRALLLHCQLMSASHVLNPSTRNIPCFLLDNSGATHTTFIPWLVPSFLQRNRPGSGSGQLLVLNVHWCLNTLI